MDSPRTPRAGQTELQAAAATACAEQQPVLQAIPLLSADDLRCVASLVRAPEPTVAAVRAVCASCPTAQARLTAYLFGPERSSTPPRQMLRLPRTPPRVVRVRRAHAAASMPVVTPPPHPSHSSPVCATPPRHLAW